VAAAPTSIFSRGSARASANTVWLAESVPWVGISDAPLLHVRLGCAALRGEGERIHEGRLTATSPPKPESFTVAKKAGA